MNFIFIDVDGVLNNSYWIDEVHEYKGVLDHVCDKNLSAFKRICTESNCYIILSSSWRKDLISVGEENESFVTSSKITQVLLDKFKENNLRIMDITDDYYMSAKELKLKFVYTRDIEIITYALSHFNKNDKFIAVDDINIDEHKLLGEHFYKTSGFTGLTEKDADNIIDYFKR